MALLQVSDARNHEDIRMISRWLSRYSREFTEITAREAVFAFDWSDVTMDFDGFINHTEQAIKPRRTVSKGVALKLMSDHNLQYRSTLPADIRERREEIIDLIMEGFTQGEAFQMVQQAI